MIDRIQIQRITFQKSYKLICILFSKISIWPLLKTWLSTFWQNPCWQSQRSNVSCSWPLDLHTSQEGLATFANSNLQLAPQILYVIKVWRLARPLQDLNPHLHIWWCSWGHMQHSSSKHGELSWCQRARLFLVWFWSHLTTTLSLSFPLNHSDVHLQTSDGLVHALSWARGPCGCCRISVMYDHWNSRRWDVAWSLRPREIDSYFVFLPFSNNHTNCCHLLTKLCGDGLVAHSSLV